LVGNSDATGARKVEGSAEFVGPALMLGPIDGASEIFTVGKRLPDGFMDGAILMDGTGEMVGTVSSRITTNAGGSSELTE